MQPPPFEIEVANQQTVLEVDLAFLAEVVRHTLTEEQVTEAVISVAVVDDASMAELHGRHLGDDSPTDVLSFLLNGDESGSSGATEVPRGRGKTIDGEVVVSAETAARQAAEFDWTPRDELVLYVVHGTLHLCGYDDLTDSERQLMRSREKAMLKHWDLAPRYSEDDATDNPDDEPPERRHDPTGAET